ncbi:hypothetical protein [Pseudoxanthomonas wuyuanensis]|uniref:SnoaL-like domain-containing protein n=1 Tax=Pseudoxanthomonas wuyuanensis TaxID=1073196 RepID=A0A286CY76_9GAMM|nr:hypothetical protein [Pseudoxanthomonas wuyuanensis]KAF1722694.1 hypothetical protein CSC75_02390 [Pseudoxanthomonas wuyuanensis]SOD51339.1 hypothetical protein SAMN06296416_101573 [Pseudoxanthomonas wuyuanensis]
MKKLLLCLLLAAAAAWYFFGRTQVNEAEVRDFYQRQFEASSKGDVGRLCGMLASDFQGVNITHVGPRQLRELNDRDETCDALEKFYDQLKKLHAMAGDQFEVDGDYTINGVEVAEDGKSATVKVRSVARLGRMRITSRSTDTVVRQHGRLVVRRSDSRSWME